MLTLAWRLVVEQVKFDIDGTIATVAINRPEARNAVDRATADALAQTYRRFDTDDTLSVAILTGAGGSFCAGADLKAVASDRGNRVIPDGDGPLGCTRMLLGQTCHRRGRRPSRRGWPRTRTMVRFARRRPQCGLRRLLPPLRRSSDRRWHRASAAAHRDESGARPHPHRTWRRRRRGVSHRPSQSAHGTGRRTGRGARARAPDRGLPRLCTRSDRLSA
jgi:Enoyl-CoA hydratase/isomerase